MRSSLVRGAVLLAVLLGLAGCQEAGPPTVDSDLTPAQEKQLEDQLKASREKEIRKGDPSHPVQ